MRINNSLKYLRTAFVGLAMTIPAKTINTLAHDVPVLKAPEIDIKLKERYFYENPVFDFYRAITHGFSSEVNTAQFYRSLDSNKKALKKELHLSDAQYDVYKNVIGKIGKAERTLDEFSEIEGYEGCSDIYYDMYKKSQDVNVLKMYRFNIKYPSKNEIALMKKHNIEYPKYNITPEKLAVRTVIHLAELEKKYPEYMEIMKKNALDKNDPKVCASIKNAKKIMKNEDLAQRAITEIDAQGLNIPLDDNPSDPLEGVLNSQDLKDLKIYAKTIILPKEDFLLEMWDRHPIIPFGKYENRACANILHLQLNK